VNVVCIGGGPAGLYLGILLKLRDPRHRIVVYERNRPTDTFGFGVVFSHATLGHLAVADPVSYAEITRHFARWDDIEIHVRGQVLRSTGHGFCGLERKQLLLILQARAVELGVEVRFEEPVETLDAVAGADVIVAADGVGSWVRDAKQDQLGPSVDFRPNKFVWLGTTVPYRAFTFLFKESPFGLFRIHAYPFAAERSTFIAECRHDTWVRAGFEHADEDQTVAVLEQIFAEELGGHRLIKNRSIWRNFPTVRCRSWHTDQLVIVGDAAHTAHFSIGSGTKLAMEDSIELAAALATAADLHSAAVSPAAVRTALAAYEAGRKPEVESLQAAAQASLEWFEGCERVMELPPPQFAYHLMTRSLKVSHASMRKRDPELVEAVEALLRCGGDRRPRHAEVRFCGHVLAGREVIDAHGDAGKRSSHGPGDVVATLVSLAGDDAVEGPRLAVIGEEVAEGAAELARRLAVLAPEAWRDVIGVAARSVEELAVLRAAAPLGVAVGLEVVDRPLARTEVTAEVAAAMQGVVAPAFVLVRPAPSSHALVASGRERMVAVPLADRLRNELSLPTVVCLDASVRGEDLDAIIAAGRADLVVVPSAAAVFSRTLSS
jgi:2-polyprenyl-6-methoxyphenol hydroxylase-like FAD-dependent oxidoreductase